MNFPTYQFNIQIKIKWQNIHIHHQKEQFNLCLYDLLHAQDAIIFFLHSTRVSAVSSKLNDHKGFDKS